MTGVFVCVVGPSGAGKDTLISGARERLAGDSRFVFPRRVVTRETSRFEDHDTVSPEQFEELEANGAFALSWAAHGLRYGVPAAVHSDLDLGRVVICNLSRGALDVARRRFPVLRVVLVTAPRAVLRERILGRGRETPDEVERRLDREAAKPALPVDLTLENVGPVDQHVARLVSCLAALSAPARHMAGAEVAR